MSLSPSKSAPFFQAEPFTFESQQYSESDNCKDEETDISEYRQQVDRECRMRIDSIVKGYEVKISKEQETFQLKEMKYVEEIEYLKRQLRELIHLSRNSRPQVLSEHCSLCANGEVVGYMKGMLDNLEADHRDCLGERSAMNARIIGLEQKLAAVEKEGDEAEERYQKAKQQIKQLRAEKQGHERERREKERQLRELQREFQVKEMAMEQELSRQIALQKELEQQARRIQLRSIEQQMRTREPSLSRQYEQAAKQQRQRQQQETIPDRQPRKSAIHEQDRALRPRELNRSTIKTAHLAPSWRTKMEESYSDYADRKRNGAGTGFPRPGDTFDTFRPSLDQLDVRKLAQGNSMKYSYMS